MFGSEVQIEGRDEKVLPISGMVCSSSFPSTNVGIRCTLGLALLCVCMCVCVCSGPQPGWDPDIVAALEAAESSNTLEDELEDDFVAMVSEAHTPV